MDRRTFVGAVSAGFTVSPLAAFAQSPDALPQIGVLLQTAATVSPTLKLLEPALRERGYTSGRDSLLEPRSSGGRPETLPALAAELVGRKVIVIVAVGPAAVEAAIGATRTIPIVAIDLESDPVRRDWVSSLARPGANVTGLFLDHPAMAGKWLDLLRETLRGIRQIALLWDSTTSSSPLEAAKAAARHSAIDVQVLEIRGGDNLEATLASGIQKGAQAIVMLSAPTIYAAAVPIAEFTRDPGDLSFPRPFAEAGGLMAYGPDLAYLFARSALYLDKILRGENPGGLPVELPTKFELVINLKAAKALGLAIPQAVLLRADEGIQ